MRILAVSDTVSDIINSPLLPKRFGDVECVLGCGDLSMRYMEYIVSMLNRPFYYVHGNHVQTYLLTADGGVQYEAQGCINIHGKIINHKGVLIAGIEGSMLYNNGPYQYTEVQIERRLLRLTPRLWWNQRRHGRALDILITHAPPQGIHDGEDLCHQGFVAYLKFMQRYKPLYLIHGHTHLYRLDAQRVTQYGGTTVLNAYGYQVIEFDEEALTSPR
ncbi:MAG: metallophosphoesterase [Chloroflexota bacterium]